DRRDRCADAGPVRRGGRARPDRGDRADRRPGGDRAVAAGRGGRPRDRWHRLHPDARVRRHPRPPAHARRRPGRAPGIRAQAVDGAWRDQRARAGQWPPDRVAGRRQAAQRAQRDRRPAHRRLSVLQRHPARDQRRGHRAPGGPQRPPPRRRRHQVHRLDPGGRALRRPGRGRGDRHAHHDAPRPAAGGVRQRAADLGARPRLDGALVRPAEAMFTDRRLQRWPAEFNNTDEQMRFAEAARLWEQAAEPGSPRWNEVMETLLVRRAGLSPTFTAYLASRDLMRMTNATWHAQYTMPALWDVYRPSRLHHGSCWCDWATEFEMDWRRNYPLWMQFVNEYKNRGGMVGIGSDCGYIYNLYGFGYVQEMELLREAGFSPLEVIHAATGMGARILGREDSVGSVRVGRKADLVLVRGNPLANLKLLFGTGTIRLDDDDRVEQVGGVDYTIKDGIVYDAAALRADVRAMVREAKAARGLPD